MATRFTSSSYRLGSQVKLSTVKKIHPEMGGWFLEAYSVMMNFRAKATNSIAQGTNSIAKVTNSFANGTNSIAKATNSIAKTCNYNQFQDKVSGIYVAVDFSMFALNKYLHARNKAINSFF